MFEETTQTRRYDEDGTKLESLGLKITKIYFILLFAGIPLLYYFGVLQLAPMSLNEVGDFLAGAFGPLAICWLVLGFFQQGRELRHSVQALQLQAKELQNSVEQQKEMVGITEKQLKLDIAVREDQTLASRSRELPFFQLRGGGSSATGGRRTYKFTAKNVGAASLSSTVALEDNPDLQLQTENLSYLSSEQEQQIQITNIDDRKLDISKEYKLTLESKNIREQVRRQEFIIKNGVPVLSDCDPELG
ncbi:hypothetical protein PXK00_02505 [Phaeobacter sp. QD34_3]|uniref:hypothetical protein n=1 Tax=unclassified Phaeobacter TaxID=2621772 RepID=UPI00237F429E|nr:MULTISPECIES: hypothetical protein [unclassified Phaeobacter]MDE4131965.1 hypothetical protein [Phaeobacter sp. QD34_3]MDE4135603.1 hypothetical protein [Phaeobacter sp. QD34_24]